MTRLSRVLWREGMHLAQHHFQAQGRYFEELTDFVFSSLFYGGYGFAGLELDPDALLNGTVTARHARGVLPDGTPFRFPDEESPEPLDVRELFSPMQDAHRVLLALPAYRPDKANCRLDSSNGEMDPRYEAATELIADEITGQNPRPVVVARKKFRLLLDIEPAEGLVVLPMARIRRDGAGHFVYDPEYVPPCTRIGASSRLMELVERLVEMLEAKAGALAYDRDRSTGVAEYASSEIARFWLTHTVHAALGPLRNFAATRSAHPERLYHELARLAGALCTFSLDADPRDLPLYDHEEPGACFGALEAHVRRHLDVVLPSHCLKVPLAPGESGFFRGAVPDPRALHRARWFLGVRSSDGEAAIAANVPRLVKVCSGAHIMKLVQRAYPGLPLEHVPVPSAEISPRVGMQYFSVKTRPPANSPGEPCWRLIADAGDVGVYVPAAIPDAELELSIILET